MANVEADSANGRTGTLPAGSPPRKVRLSRRELNITFVCFLIVFIDGVDTAAISYVAPTLARDWQLTKAMLTPAFVMTSVGAVIGYLLSIFLEAHYRRRSILTWSVVAFGVMSIATAFCGDITSLATARLLTAVALGAVLPSAVSCAADNAPPDRRAAIVTSVTMGIAAGAGVGGFLATPLLMHFGWEAVFVGAGGLSGVVIPLIRCVIPDESAKEAKTAVTKDPHISIRSMDFQKGSGIQILIIWLIAFTSFFVTYAFRFWIPTLLTSLRFTAETAPLGAGAFGVGGLIGNLAIIPIVSRCRVQRVLFVTSLIAVVSFAALSLPNLGQTAILLLLGGAGCGLACATVGQTTLAVVALPANTRTAGLATGAAIGRVGSIIGPAIGGTMLADHVGVQSIMRAACLPTGLVALLFLASLVVNRSHSEIRV